MMSTTTHNVTVSSMLHQYFQAIRTIFMFIKNPARSQGWWAGCQPPGKFSPFPEKLYIDSCPNIDLVDWVKTFKSACFRSNDLN